MTITEEQIQQELDAIYVGDVTGKGAHIGRLKAIVIQQRSEVERLRAEVRFVSNQHIEQFQMLQDADQQNRKLQAENARLKSWIDDLQSGMFVNCVYCGHRYGPKGDTPTSMADILKEHITQCSQHPLSIALAENAELRKERDEAFDAGVVASQRMP